MPRNAFQKVTFALTLVTLASLGDIFDVLSFAGQTGLLFFLIKKWQMKNPHSWPPLAQNLVFATLQICFLTSLNRVWGYPDKELWQYFIPLFSFVWQIFLIAVWALKQWGWRVFVLMLALLYLPITEWPTLTVRTVTAQLFLKNIPDNTKIHYVSHIGLHQAFAVATLKLQGSYFENKSKTETWVVAVFKREGRNYTFQKTVWLLNPCTGSMDCQSPNLPLILEWAMKRL